MPNGAQALLQTMLNAGIDTCFTNPGTSEMHFVAALDGAPEMRAVLALFEGVATGAADGYARMADKPAATLLHLGCGLGNGLANLHNARKARVPMLNIVGDHARYHVKYDALLQSDIETVARNVSPWVRTSQNTEQLSQDALDAIADATIAPASVSTLILPADVSWGEGASPAVLETKPVPNSASDGTVAYIVEQLKQSGKIAIVLGGKALREPALLVAAGIAQTTGAKLFAEAFPARMSCGAELPTIERIEYDLVQLVDFDMIVLVDVVEEAVGDLSTLNRLSLASTSQDALSSLTKLSEALAAAEYQAPSNSSKMELASGELTIDSACQTIAAMLPENAIVADESNVSASKLSTYFSKAAKHDLLTLTGDGIGQSLPVSIGAAIASPNSAVFVLVDSQNAMPTIQSLWTMAREKLNIQVVVFNSKTTAQKSNTNNMDFVALSRGMGVPGTKVESIDDLMLALEKATTNKAPGLIELDLE